MFHPDWPLVGLVALTAAFSCLAGAGFCWARHKQRGIETDALDVVWPDTIPDWLSEAVEDLDRRTD